MGPDGRPAAWKRNDPMVNIDRLVANNTRIWVYCGNGTAVGPRRRHDAAATCSTRSSSEGFTLRTNKTFQRQLHRRRRHATVCSTSRANGTHSWGYWGAQLQAMKPDMVRILTTPTPTATAPRTATSASGRATACAPRAG